ncbi:class I SAM-dependent methyltransferase [Azonexus sp. R2A61]|uniref:Eco57I restriction-modification methylase domain-containing protein n=1 Tax=Azonexus sp. R2A61 TaxID=2744443 RepID=UPI001F344DA0|nr:class I SAM-dependent methyltransferase [Azonexus sp. R2A61]
MPLDVERLGQVFTPPSVVEFMLGLCRNRGRVLEPSAGDGAFYNALRQQGRELTGVEIDRRVAPAGARVMDFFALPESERFATIVGNPPYVRYQDIAVNTRKRLKSPLFDKRSNLFLFFIEKCIRHLEPGGELVFIVPREFIKLTSARKLNAWLFTQGSITHFFETGDVRVFAGATPNCCIFRFEKGRFERRMDDGRTFTEVDGQLMFLRENHSVRLADLFEVRVGGVSGADPVFRHPEGNLDFVCSKTADTGETRRMIYGIEHPALLPHKQRLLARRVRKFDEDNWWHWGRHFPVNDDPRIYVNGRTRKPEPFFLHDCPNFDGAILALFPKNRRMRRRDLIECTMMLNHEVDWQQLGFVCDGRFLFTQRSLQTCLLPDKFSRYLPKDET